MNEPELIRIDPDKVTVDKVRQVIYFPSMAEKVGLLVGLLKKLNATRTMVFVNMKRTAARLETARHVGRGEGHERQRPWHDDPRHGRAPCDPTEAERR